MRCCAAFQINRDGLERRRIARELAFAGRGIVHPKDISGDVCICLRTEAIGLALRHCRANQFKQFVESVSIPRQRERIACQEGISPLPLRSSM